MTWTDFRGSQFPDDDDGYGRWNIVLLVIQPPDVAASLRAFILHGSVAFFVTELV
jgi:hypothetical protein